MYADSTNSLAREAAYRLFLYPDKHQEELLKSLLEARHELAMICGFETFAHRALKSSTVENPNTVNEFLDILNDKLRSRAEVDFKTMQNMKTKEAGFETPLAAWDTPYFTSKLKKQCLQVSSLEFAPYFSLGACMEGLNTLMHSLYGITLQNTELAPGESWSKDIYKLSVLHEKEGLLGYIYCDLFERQGKPNQDCHFTIQGGKVLSNNSYQVSYRYKLLYHVHTNNTPKF